MQDVILVTGGAGFIGSNYVLNRLGKHGGRVINLDKLTYAGNLENLKSVEQDGRYAFVEGDIGDRELVRGLLERFQPSAIVNFAAESHVDRSIHGPEDFILTNVNGTFHLLEETRAYWQPLKANEQEKFRFLHVSTDEVYGSLNPGDAPFTEQHPYAPNSPYSASKASSDHLVRAYHHTYGLPTLTTNCSNNYGPYQFPEKLIPLMLMNALDGKPLPIYGDGSNIRDWLYVTDHCDAIDTVLDKGAPGEVYNIGGLNEKTNLEIVHTLCELLEELVPDNPNSLAGENANGFRSLITYVKDRPGHDQRYAIDARKIERDLGWRPAETFDTGIRKTVQWYLDNLDWVKRIISGDYRNWIERNYQQREVL